MCVACNKVFVIRVEVDDVVFEYLCDVETADCEFLDVERLFEVDVDCVVDVVYAEPQTLVTRFGHIDKFDFEFGLGEVVDVNHKRHVKSEVRGRITLRGGGHFNHNAREVADYAAHNLAQVERTFGDAEFEFNREAHRDDGVVEHICRDIFECVRILGFVGVLDFDFLAIVPVGVRFAVADVCREQFIPCAEAYFDSAEFETHIDATDCEVESDIVIADLVVEVDCSVIIAAFVFDVAEQTSSQLLDLSFFAVVADVGVACDVGVGDAFNAVRSSVHLVTAQTYGRFDFRNLCIVVCVGMDILALHLARNRDVFAVFEDCIGLARFVIAVFESLLVAVYGCDLSAFVNCHFVNVSGACKIVCVACFVVSVG